MDSFVYHYSRSHNEGFSLQNSSNDTKFGIFEKKCSIIKTSRRGSTRLLSIIKFSNWKTKKKLMKYVRIK